MAVKRANANTQQLPGALASGNTGGLVQVDPSVTGLQARIVPDATPRNNGLMSGLQAGQLATLVAGGGGGVGPLAVVPLAGPTTYAANFGDLVIADTTAGAIGVDLPLASSLVPGKQNVIAIKNSGQVLGGGGAFQVNFRTHIGDGTDVSGVLWPGDFVYLVCDGINSYFAISSRYPTNSDNLTPTTIAAYIAVPGDFVQCDPSGGAFNVTLPSANSAGPGTVIEVKNRANTPNAVTVLTTGGDTIDGNPSVDIAAFESIRFVSDGINDWMQA
jgi:hypothetical protein